MDVEIDDDRDINEILDDIRAELQCIGKDRSMTVDDMSRQINYPIYENEELLEKLKRAPMVSYLDPWLRFEVKRLFFYVIHSHWYEQIRKRN